MSVVDDSDIAPLLRDEALEAPVDCRQLAQLDEYILLGYTQQKSRTIDSKEIVDIELTDQTDKPPIRICVP